MISRPAAPRRTYPFGARLRALRAARNLSLADLARIAYVSRGHISNLERGVKAPGVDTARVLVAALRAGGELTRLVAEAEIADREVTVPTYDRTHADVADAHQRGVDEGIDITVEVVRRHLTAAQRHAVEQDIAALLANPSMDGARRLVDQRRINGEPA